MISLKPTIFLFISFVTSLWHGVYSQCFIKPKKQKFRGSKYESSATETSFSIEKNGLISLDCFRLGEVKPSSIQVQFFDDEEPVNFSHSNELEADGGDSLREKTVPSNDEYYWSGEDINTNANALNLIVTIESEGFRMCGSASIWGKVYNFASLPDLSIQVLEIDGSNFPPEIERSYGRTLFLSGNEIPSGTLSAVEADDNDIIIDIICLYTPQSVCLQVTGTEECDAIDPRNSNIMDNVCKLSVFETNTAFKNSGALTKLNLVHSGLISPDYVEEKGEKMCRPLKLLKSSNATAYANARKLRDDYGADLVSLIVSQGSYCGCGDFFSGNDEDSFSVIHEMCATGYYSFGHEIGHNLGCGHNRPQLTTEKTEGSAFGFQDPSSGFRTIMAYNCESGYCPRIQLFSTNELYVRYKTLPVGDDFHNNVKQINLVSKHVSNYRQSIRRHQDRPGQRPTDYVEHNLAPPSESPTVKISCKGNNVQFTVDIETDGDESDISWYLINRRKIISHRSSDYESMGKANTCIWSGNCFTFVIMNSGLAADHHGQYRVYADGTDVANGSIFDQNKSHNFRIDRKNKFLIELNGKQQKKGCMWLRQKTKRRIKKLCKITPNLKSKCPNTCGNRSCSSYF